MPQIPYLQKSLSTDVLATIEQANEIITEYAAAGYTLTLRQLFYQFVANELISNTTKAYKRLGTVINDARMCGLLDWDLMEDRTRNLRTTATWDSPADIIGSCARQFAVDLWYDQPRYVEVWIEKDALLGILQVACEPFQVPYFSCRGYTSVSEIWRAVQRFKDAMNAAKRIRIIHLGDHDPSGCDMTRDIEDRIRSMLEWHEREEGFPVDIDFEVVRIALNNDQIRKYKLPPNPAKVTDSRARKYIQRHGNKSWELDALSPTVLSGLIMAHIRVHLDMELFDKRCELSKQGKLLLSKAETYWTRIEKLLNKIPEKKDGKNKRK